MKPKGKTELQNEAMFTFQRWEALYRPCEVVYIISELTKTLSLVMLQRDQEAD